MRPAKSFWKNGRFCRTTCQWLCQRTRFVTPGSKTFCRMATSAKMTTGRMSRISTIIAINIGACCAIAAWRSTVSINATSLPMNTGITMSISATARLVANTARYQPRVWRTKCQ